MGTQPFSTIVLAAGQGTRMKSTLPKVLHPLAGRPLLHYPIRAAQQAGAAEVVVVVGTGKEQVESSLIQAFPSGVTTALQAEQKGTGHAAQCALPAIADNQGIVLILCGDTPLLVAQELQALVEQLEQHPDIPLAMLTCMVDDPTGYGRILRDSSGNVVGIREHKDCSEQERTIREINPGVYAVRFPFLKDTLPKLRANNAQHEIYLTDVVEQAARAGGVVAVTALADNLVGINDRQQLALAEESMFERIRTRWRKAGVTIRKDVQIDDSVQLGPDARLERGVVLRGTTSVGSGSVIDVGSVLTDMSVGEGVMVKPYSVLTQSKVGTRAQIGPFSHLRPDSDIHEDAHIGNYVEVKKTVVRAGAKANHLAYLGDGDIGAGANIGAGTIFCNYDGFQKHKTTIGEGAFIGSDSQLVAPVTIGKNAYVGTGTTVTKDVPEDALAIGRAKQENKEGYGARLRGRLQAIAAAKKKSV
jgi:bifunctional UDP-N-acetylglucosamine pyrophosphorylase / glucosamine-1-phosphate N-acetyltransferase